jgi:hypothetical protein
VAGCTWRLTLPNLVRGHAGNPYIGLLLFVALPILFFIGLVMMPIGFWFSRHAVHYYCQSHPEVYQSRAGDVELAGKALLAIYNENVFPDLAVTWGTYVNNLGHTDSPGCFRCHDEAHTSADKKTITQDCGACHEIVNSAEASPEILRTLGVEKRISTLQKK